MSEARSGADLILARERVVEGAGVGQSARAWKLFDDFGVEGRGRGRRGVWLWCWENLEGGTVWERLLPEGWVSIL